MAKAKGGIQNPHPSVLKRGKDHALYIEDVLEWLEYNVQEGNAQRILARRGDKSAIAKRYIHEGYAREIRHYLRNGDWISDFFGKNQEHKVRWVTVCGERSDADI